MTAENFANTAEATAEAQDDPAAAQDLLVKAQEYRAKSKEHMAYGIVFALEIGEIEKKISAWTEQSDKAEEDFAEAMGEMLREGYWSDSQYVPGQEDTLYADALEVSRQMAQPQCEWVVQTKDLKEEIEVNQRLRIYDEYSRLKAYAFVEKLTIHPREEWDNEISISTDELGMNSKSLENILSRVTEMAEILRTNAAMYERASSISDDGTVTAKILEGTIDVTKNRILAGGSNWYTDEKGNIIFVSLDGQSAMMLTGMGFMIADSWTEDGQWNWRTFGTGSGFTADMITAGYLSADRIRSNSITANHIAPEAGAALDLSANESVGIRIQEELDETDLAKYKAWFAFSDSGMTVGEGDSDMRLQLSNDEIAFLGGSNTLSITNDRISFKEGGENEVAYISDNKLSITHAEIKNSMKIGNFAWEPQGNGNMSIIFKE